MFRKRLLSDILKRQIDLPHIAATIERTSFIYISYFWLRWEGDLASGMKDIREHCAESLSPDSIYYGKSTREVADMTIGSEYSKCNYSDFCSDFDAYKISTYITKNTSSLAHYAHLFSDALKWYYVTNEHYRKRFEWILYEIDSGVGSTPLFEKISSYMNGTLETAPKVGLLALKGDSPSQQVNDACCMAFKNYIQSMLDII